MRIQGVVMYETDWVKARNTTISMHESWIDEVTCHCMIYIQDERDIMPQFKIHELGKGGEMKNKKLYYCSY